MLILIAGGSSPLSLIDSAHFWLLAPQQPCLKKLPRKKKLILISSAVTYSKLKIRHCAEENILPNLISVIRRCEAYCNTFLGFQTIFFALRTFVLFLLLFLMPRGDFRDSIYGYRAFKRSVNTHK